MNFVSDSLRLELVAEGAQEEGQGQEEGGRAVIAVLTLLERPGVTFAWGTRASEHRISRDFVAEMNRALDAVLAVGRGGPEGGDGEGPSLVSALVVANEGKFFCNGLDLSWISQNMGEAETLQREVELLLARILTFPLPTVAAISGHFCAAGAMLGLAFDNRFMTSSRGLFFVPAVDLGLTYSDGMTELMMAKTPTAMHSDMICFARRYTGADLLHERVVSATGKDAEQVRDLAIDHARLISTGRFGTEKYRSTLQEIKGNTWRRAVEGLRLGEKARSMGFRTGDWNPHGRSKL